MHKSNENLSEKQIFVGCDVSKDTLDFAIFEHGVSYRLFKHICVENEAEGFKKMLKWLKDNGVKKFSSVVIAFEHTGYYSLALAEWLFKKKITFCLLHPLDVKNYISTGRNKTDADDSRLIADYIYTMKEKCFPSTPEHPKVKKLRELRKERNMAVKSRTRYLNMLKTIDEASSRRRIESIINDLTTAIKAIEKELMEVVKSDKAIQNNYQLLNSIPGIGMVNVINTIVATGNFTRFSTARQYAKFCCVSPLSHESGTSVKGGNHVSKKGHNELKSDLTEAARSAVAHDCQMRTYFERKKVAGKEYGCIMNAIKFKLICRMFAVIERQTPYVNFEAYRKTS